MWPHLSYAVHTKGGGGGRAGSLVKCLCVLLFEFKARARTFIMCAILSLTKKLDAKKKKIQALKLSISFVHRYALFPPDALCSCSRYVLSPIPFSRHILSRYVLELTHLVLMFLVHIK